MELRKQRLLAWWRESLENIRNGKWWIVGIGVVTWLVVGAVEHRLFGWVNTYVDAHGQAFVSRLLTFGSLKLPMFALAVAVLFIVVRAYFKSEPGLVGTADLMVQELEVSDLEFVDGGKSYEINLAAFARMEIASVDKPRTVTRFEIEMVAPDGTRYQASSEYELGNYQHKHDFKKLNEWGGSTIQSVREPMEDLAAKLRVPVQPFTHVGRAWVRFEIPHVRQGHEPKNCTVKIFAIDPSGRRHVITTNGMQVKAIADHEYAVASNR